MLVWSSRNSPGFDPSGHRHKGIWGAADEAVLKNVLLKNPQKSPLIFLFYIFPQRVPRSRCPPPRAWTVSPAPRYWEPASGRAAFLVQNVKGLGHEIELEFFDKWIMNTLVISKMSLWWAIAFAIFPSFKVTKYWIQYILEISLRSQLNSLELYFKINSTSLQ